jgi:hypothetical protein
MTIRRVLLFSILMSATSIAGPALAQNCPGRASMSAAMTTGGMVSGDTIIFADGARSSLTSQHPSVIIGHKSSVIVGQGVFVGKSNGMVPMEKSERSEQGALPGSRRLALLAPRNDVYLLVIPHAGIDRAQRP